MIHDLNKDPDRNNPLRTEIKSIVQDNQRLPKKGNHY